ncbi:hypothetical protein K439DRAFT_1625204 [Ramaria rubella]|nr:hypothetical protein K439DRAFT_1625204 [Ramaria rubella]
MPAHQELSKDGRQYWCNFCQTFVRIRGFSQHANTCERKQCSVEAVKCWKIKKQMEWLTAHVVTLEVTNELEDSSTSGPSPSQDVTSAGTHKAQLNMMIPDFDVRNNSMAISVESEDSDSLSSDPESTFGSDSEEPARRPTISSTYIEIVHHPHSGLEPEYVFRDLPPSPKAPLSTQPRPAPGERPWAPFQTCADFEFAETAVQSAMSAKTIKKLIRGIKHDWTDPSHSKITYQNLDDYHQSLNFSRNYVVQVRDLF